MKVKKLTAILLILILTLTACGLTKEDFGTGAGTSGSSEAPAQSAASAPTEDTAAPEDSKAPENTDSPGDAQDLPKYGENYYDVKNVTLYIDAYGELPPNYITKKEARDLGWSGGTVEDYREGAAIGGDRFGNYEGLLPEADGRFYTECDIDTLGFGSRGSRRLVFSNDGLYFYTDDHYETFTEVTIVGGDVQW